MAPFARPAAAAAALIAALLAGGCSTTVAGTASPDPAPRPTAGPGADPVAWGDKVCGSLLSYYQPLSTTPDFQGADFAAIKTRLADYLGAVAGGIGQGQNQLKAVGASPVSGGDQFAKAIGEMFTRNSGIVSQAKTEVDSINPQDVNGFQAKLKSAQDKLTTIGAARGLESLGATPRLDKAVSAAPKCKQLNELTKPKPQPR